MSKITDGIDAVGVSRESLPLRGAAVHPDPTQEAAWLSAIGAGRSASELAADQGTTPTLLLDRESPPEAVYRGHSCWLSGPGTARSVSALRVLEEFALADEAPARRKALCVGAAVLCDDELPDDLEPLLAKIEAYASEGAELPAEARNAEVASDAEVAKGRALIDGLAGAAVWAPEGSSAFIVETAGAPTAAGWAEHPVHVISAWIDGGQTSPSGCFMRIGED